MAGLFFARAISKRSHLAWIGTTALCVGLIVSSLIPGCEFVNEPPPGGEGPAHRRQDLALSPQQELKLGRAAYQEMMANPDHFGHVLPGDHPSCRRARAVAARIIRAAEIEPLQREINLRQGYRFEWEVNVFDRPEINAFCLPGGKIGVFSGLLRVAQNDDQLATVISHEISHALAHHSSERLARGGINRGPMGAIWSKAFDRDEESEADHIGLFLMTFAGYDPEEAVRFWERMRQISSNRARLPEILSDHPSDERRIQDMKSWVPKAKAAKQALDEGNIEPTPSRTGTRSPR